MSLAFLDEARAEYLDALRRYRKIDPRLATDLAHLVDKRLELAVARPGASRIEKRHAAKRFDLRWYSIRRFPYALLIGTLAGRRVVVAFAYLGRKPGYWTKRLKEEEKKATAKTATTKTATTKKTPKGRTTKKRKKK